MRNPKPAESINPKKRVESSEATPTPEPPVMEESTNGEKPTQPPVMEEPAGEPKTTPANVAAVEVSASPNPERVSALAVVSVVSSLLGFLGVTSLLGLALGIVALKQMAANPQLTGRHLAILGVCLSVFWLVLLLAMGSIMWVGLSLLNDLIKAIFGGEETVAAVIEHCSRMC